MCWLPGRSQLASLTLAPRMPSTLSLSLARTEKGEKWERRSDDGATLHSLAHEASSQAGQPVRQRERDAQKARVQRPQGAQNLKKGQKADSKRSDFVADS